MFLKKTPKTILHLRIVGSITPRTSETFAPLIKNAYKSEFDAIALSINSGTGSLSETKKLSADLTKLSEAKIAPIYSFIENYALDVGYMLASCGHQISASPFSVIGDLERSSQLISLQKFYEKFGISYLNHQNFEKAANTAQVFGQNCEDWARLRQETIVSEKAELVEFISQQRELSFIQTGLKPASRKKINSGGIFTANDAMKNGLVDKIETFLDFRKSIFPNHQILENVYRSRYNEHQWPNKFGILGELFRTYVQNGPIGGEDVEEAILKILTGAKESSNDGLDITAVYNWFCERNLDSMIAGE